jgi:hypothetical protein
MDGAEVYIGDSMHDMQFGRGRVVEILSNNRVILNFAPTNRRYTFNTLTGCMNGRQFRTLFWQDPVLAVPVKDDAQWVLMRNICTSVVNSFRT